MRPRESGGAGQGICQRAAGCAGRDLSVPCGLAPHLLCRPQIAALDGQLAAVNRQLAGAKAEAETLKAQVGWWEGAGAAGAPVRRWALGARLWGTAATLAAQGATLNSRTPCACLR